MEQPVHRSTIVTTDVADHPAPSPGRRRHLVAVAPAWHAPAPDATPADTPPPTPAARRAAEQRRLMAVGTAMHLFAEPLETFAAIDRLDLHRATAVLTKQVLALLDEDVDDPMRALADLVTDPDRTALADGTAVTTLCRTAWPIVLAIAGDRIQASIDGATAFGHEALLHLAATRAAGTRHPWWGTQRWTELVGRADFDGNTTDLLLDAPERVPTSLLTQVLAGPWTVDG